MTHLNFKTAEDHHFDYAIQFLESCVTSFSDVQKLFDKGIDLYILELDNNVVNVSTSLCDSYDYVENNDYAEDRYSAYVFIIRDYDEEEICNTLNITIPRKNYIEVLEAIDYEETRDLDDIESFMNALSCGQTLKNAGVTDFDIDGVEDAYHYLENLYNDIKFPERKIKEYIIKKMSEDAHIMFDGKATLNKDNILVSIRTYQNNMKFAYKIFARSGEDLTYHFSKLLNMKMSKNFEIYGSGFGTCRLFELQQALKARADLDLNVVGITTKNSSRVLQSLNAQTFKHVGLA